MAAPDICHSCPPLNISQMSHPPQCCPLRSAAPSVSSPSHLQRQTLSLTEQLIVSNQAPRLIHQAVASQNLPARIHLWCHCVWSERWVCPGPYRSTGKTAAPALDQIVAPSINGYDYEEVMRQVRLCNLSHCCAGWFRSCLPLLDLLASCPLSDAWLLCNAHTGGGCARRGQVCAGQSAV